MSRLIETRLSCIDGDARRQVPTRQAGATCSLTRHPAACVAACSSLKSLPYAVVGGAACVLLGSDRQTSDVDIVVPKGAVVSVRDCLRNQHAVTVDRRTGHTAVNPPGTTTRVPVELLCPPAMFRYDYTQATPIIIVDVGNVAIRVLHSLILLHVKLEVVTRRELIARLIDIFGGLEQWVSAGYDAESGLLI